MTAATVPASAAPKRPSFRSRSWTMAAIRADRGLRDAEDRAQGLEGAAVGLVAERHAEHVEGHGVVGQRVTVGGEGEARGRVDESPDQPRRAHAVHARTRPGHPQASGVGGEVAGRGRAGCRLGVAARLVFECAEQGGDAVAAGAAEEVDPFEGGEPRAKALDQAAHGRLPRAAWSSRGVEPLDDSLDLLGQRRDRRPVESVGTPRPGHHPTTHRRRRPRTRWRRRPRP